MEDSVQYIGGRKVPSIEILHVRQLIRPDRSFRATREAAIAFYDAKKRKAIMIAQKVIENSLDRIELSKQYLL